MATRYVFKFFGSIGPSGSLIGLTEKICTALYPWAYNFGDQSQMESEIDIQLRDMRKAYINEVFKYRGVFQRKTAEGQDENTVNEGYDGLIKIIKSYIEKTTRLEKNKYMRERLYYQREGQIVLYEEANKNYHKCDEEVTDNLVKQAITVCQPNVQVFEEKLKAYKIDFDDEAFAGDIKEKIKEYQAREYLQAWDKIVSEHEATLNRLKQLKASGGEVNEVDQDLMDMLLDQDQQTEDTYKKDKLFIETGEDVEDIFAAFKAWKLM